MSLEYRRGEVRSACAEHMAHNAIGQDGLQSHPQTTGLPQAWPASSTACLKHGTAWQMQRARPKKPTSATRNTARNWPAVAARARALCYLFSWVGGGVVGGGGLVHHTMVLMQHATHTASQLKDQPGTRTASGTCACAPTWSQCEARQRPVLHHAWPTHGIRMGTACMATACMHRSCPPLS